MATQVQDTEDFTEGHRTGEGWKKTRKDSFLLALSVSSRYPPSAIFSLSFRLRLADQMFEKINKTLPAGSFHRLLSFCDTVLSLFLPVAFSLGSSATFYVTR